MTYQSYTNGGLIAAGFSAAGLKVFVYGSDYLPEPINWFNQCYKR